MHSNRDLQQDLLSCQQIKAIPRLKDILNVFDLMPSLMINIPLEIFVAVSLKT